MLSVLLGLISMNPAAAAMKRGFNQLLDAVVRIDVREVEFDTGAKRFSASIGSGVILTADGLVLTNAHVASPNAVEINVTLASLERVGAHLVGWDHWTDLAVLQLDGAEIARRELSFAHAEFGRSSKLVPGQTVYAVGTPHGLTRTVTRGIISNPQRYFEDAQGVRGYETGSFNTWLQTDAAINPGNSGGPLVTEEGAVIGINARSYLGAENLSFAIPADVARKVLEALVRHGQITRSYIGVVPGALQDLENFYALSQNTGVLINSVDTGSPAARAGLRGGDILLAINGHRVDGRFPEQLPGIQNLIAGQPVGSTLRLTVKRGTQNTDYSVTSEQLESRVGEPWAFEKWGLSVRTVSRTYAREKQLESAGGLVVLGVQSGFPAAVAGMARDDIITKINGKPVASLETAKNIYVDYEVKPEPTLIETSRNHRVSLYILKP